MAIPKPQVVVHQEYSLTPSEITEPLRALIAGPNAQLHRYTDTDEKPLTLVGAYNKDEDVCYPWPGRTAGSLVDFDYTRVFVDDALLLYHEDLINDASGGRGTVTVVSGRTNWIRSSALSYKANGASYPRSALFLDRDVAVGDRVELRGVANVDTTCDEVILNTYVTGFAADEVASVVGDARRDDNNQPTTTAATTITKIAGAENCIAATANGSLYDGLADGYVTETYTIEVIRSSVAGCQAARLRVVSASGTDNDDEVTPAAFGSATSIGSRGLRVTFSNTGSADCSSEASAADVTETEFVVGQKWRVTVTQAFERTCAESGGTYGGAVNDVYVVTVTRGGAWADLPEISVTTAKNLDSSGPTEVTGAYVAVPVGTHGVTIKFTDCLGSSSSSSGASGDAALDEGLRTGDKFYITVTSASNGPVRTLILKHDVPASIRDAADLDLRLFIAKDGLELSVDRLSAPPLTNWEQESTQICLKAGATAYDPTWTSNGVERALPLWSGNLYIHYREWLAELTNSLVALDDVANINQVPGPLDVDNPLKWGLFKALQNSNGTVVRGAAVLDPTDLDDWQRVLERVDGRDDIYNLVPLTTDKAVQDLFHAHVESESSPETGNWKAAFFALSAPSSQMVVGKSSAADQALRPTSTDGEVVLATIADNPNATGTQYTLLSVDSGNAGFLTHGVASGDVVRFLFTVDAFGNSAYTEFIVDTVLSEDSLLLLSGHDVSVSEPQKVEIWHTLTKDELVATLVDKAQAFADKRVVAVWPDLLGNAGVTMAGYYAAASLAGLVSGVQPHQGLTNVEVSGYDDAAARTRDYFSDTQLRALADGGVWIVTEDRNGTVHTRHALTTDTTDINHREEMVRRNLDAISYLFRRRLGVFIGRANATPSMVDKLELEVGETIDYLKTSGYTDDLGPQVISGELRSGYPRIHPLLADQIEIVLDWVLPAPLNQVSLYLVL